MPCEVCPLFLDHFDMEWAMERTIAMLKVSQLMRARVYRPKKKDAEEPASLDVKELARIGQVRQVVFSPKGNRVVGVLARRPDVAGMVKREDAFVALDSFVVTDSGLVLTRGQGGLDAEAIERLGLDWDRCILWTGMDAKTTDGKELGWVSDVEFDPNGGKVEAFYVGDGSVAESLVGDVVVPVEMLVGYADGFMLVRPEAATMSLNGGLAAKAGTSYAKAKYEGKQAAEKAGKVAEEAVGKGAREVGRALGRTKGMFGAFMSEYKKASK